jgi:cytochrome c553
LAAAENQNLSHAEIKMTMTPIEKAIAKRRESHARGEVIQIEHNFMKKALAAPNSRAKAIAAFCFHCHGGTENELPDPGWKNMIRDCTSETCPLRRHRPYK